jgi:serine protease Do
LAGRAVDDPTGLRYATAELGAGVQVPLVYYRDGEERTVDVTVAAVPTNPDFPRLGFRVREGLGPDRKQTVVEVDRVVSASPAFAAGIRPGMAILGVDKTPVHSALELLSILKDYDLERGLVLVVRTPDGRFGPVTIPAPGGPRRDEVLPAPLP